MSVVLAFLGRLLLAFLFLSSGLQKLQTFDLATGGPVMAQMGPKMDTFLKQIDDFLGENGWAEKSRLNKAAQQERYPYVLGLAIFLEVAGSLLFTLNKPIGAHMLIIFTVPCTVIMHDFWNLPENSPAQFVDMVMFFKNVAIVGALLMYLGMRPTVARPPQHG